MEEKERYEWYYEKCEIIDNETGKFVEDVVERLNTQDFNKKELLKAKQILSQENTELKSLHEHDKELVAKVLERVCKELENETETYCEIRQCTSPHYQGDYVWFNYVRFREFVEKLKEKKNNGNINEH